MHHRQQHLMRYPVSLINITHQPCFPDNHYSAKQAFISDNLMRTSCQSLKPHMASLHHPACLSHSPGTHIAIRDTTLSAKHDRDPTSDKQTSPLPWCTSPPLPSPHLTHTISTAKVQCFQGTKQQR